MSGNKGTVFKVLWRMPGAPKDENQDWVCDTLMDLMKALASEGITPKTVEKLYVHCVVKIPGEQTSVMECVAIENSDPKKIVDIKTFREAVKSRTEAAKTAKPHIKLTATQVESSTAEPDIVSSTHLYSALQV